MFGLLNLDKPAGLTSRDVVNRVQRLVKPLKVGHAGTLDPLATGVLVVCLGQATRLVEYVQQMPKRYLAKFLLGQLSDTEDIEGEVVHLQNPPIPSRAEIQDMLPRFLGIIQQLPPAYSALKVQGQRAYDLARRGIAPDLQPRPVEIHQIELIAYDYPRLELDIRCGSGTYVRSLGRDIALALGNAAVMSQLERTEIGPFAVGEGLAVDDLTLEQIQSHLLPATMATSRLPSVGVTGSQSVALRQGKRISATPSSPGDQVAALDESENLVAILKPAEGGLFQPVLVFAEVAAPAGK